MEDSNNLLYNSLEQYYDNDKYFDNLVNIIVKKQISLRIIDWFVSNYSKKYGSLYIIYKDGNGNLTLNETDEIYKQFNVHHSYKSQLKSFSKKNFDPFCRRDRIIMNKKDIKIKTTLGQLNFFKWAIENRVINYIENHHIAIEDDMNSRNSTSKKKTVNQQKTRKKREELSISASKSIKREEVEIIVEFK